MNKKLVNGGGGGGGGSKGKQCVLRMHCVSPYQMVQVHHLSLQKTVSFPEELDADHQT